MRLTSLSKEKRLELITLCSIIFVSLIVRLFLLINVANPMYYYDSYGYYFDAWKLEHFGVLPSYRPLFVFSIAGWLYLFGFLGDSLFIARIFSVFLSLIVICVVYLLALRIMPWSFAFAVSLLVSMEPSFLSLSITTHNEPFYILFALSSLCFSLSQSKIAYLVLAPMSVAISCLTSEWIYILIGPALLLIYVFKILKAHMNTLRKCLLSTMIILVYFSVFLLPQVWSLYYRTTRFSPLQRVTIFLNPDFLIYVLYMIMNIVPDNPAVGFFLAFFVFLGSLLIIFDFFKSAMNSFRHRRCNVNPLGKGEELHISVVMIFFANVLVITIFALPYIIVGNQVFSLQKMNWRYATLPRVLALLILAYTCARIVKTFREVHILNAGHGNPTILGTFSKRTARACRTIQISRVRHKIPEAGKLFHATAIMILVVFAATLTYPSYYFISSSSSVLGNFVDATSWLKENLRDGEVAIVPFDSVFYSLAPELYGRLMNYQGIWILSGIMLTANTTMEDILLVRRTLYQLLQNRTEIGYLAYDYVDPYAQLLFYSGIVGDELSSMLSPPVTFPLRSAGADPVEIVEVRR